ncbi:MAG: exo-alpha-sialidase [bacterium]|nr:exo-alpha-sialidase [bacterium]
MAPNSTDPALQAPPIITNPGPKYGPDTRIFQGIPGIERAANGRLWATWYGGGSTEGPENYVMLATSDDDGTTWSDLTLVIDPYDKVRTFDAALWHDPLGRMWLFWAQAYEFWDGRAGVWAIVTEDATVPEPLWSEPRRLCNGVMMNKPTVLSTDEWLLPVAVWNLSVNIENIDQRYDLGSESGANVVGSTDQGATWTLWGQAEVPQRRCAEHMVVERRDGSLWMLARTEYGIGESFSTDSGKTWTLGEPSDVHHIRAARFFIRRLASGRLLLVKHDPPGLAAPAPDQSKAHSSDPAERAAFIASLNTRSHLKAFLSDDDGATWYGGLVLDERQGISYPDGVEAPDGTVYIIYDFSRHDQKEILMATFAEEDVAEGAAVSECARTQVLVNKATGRREE